MDTKMASSGKHKYCLIQVEDLGRDLATRSTNHWTSVMVGRKLDKLLEQQQGPSDSASDTSSASHAAAKRPTWVVGGLMVLAVPSQKTLTTVRAALMALLF